MQLHQLNVKRRTMDLALLNDVILGLHRLGRTAAHTAFQPAALELIGDVIPFDSAWWGNASADPPEIHRLHLHNCEESILQDYLPFMNEDFFRAALIANPGRSINVSDLTTRAKLLKTPLYQCIGKRYRVEWSLGTLLVEPVSSLYEFLTLWRHDPQQPFSEAERQTKELLMPHLCDAHRNSLLASVLGEPRQRSDQWAICDERGYLRQASPSFIHYLRAEWPQWQGSRLPDVLLAQVTSAPDSGARRQRVQVTHKGTFRYLEVQASQPLDALTPRELEVARRYAVGETHATIAKALNLSPATVRNHMARSYRKLSVNNKSELTLRLTRPTQRRAG